MEYLAHVSGARKTLRDAAASYPRVSSTADPHPPPCIPRRGRSAGSSLAVARVQIASHANEKSPRLGGVELDR